MSARARREIEQLYRGHRDAVYRSVLRDVRDPEEAEDVTQTAFLQAYRSVLRGRRPDSPRAWLLTIADNLRRRRFLRSHGRPREVPLQDDVASAEAQPIGELREALERLPFNQRAAFVLRELGGLSYGEIARRLDVTVGSVQMLLFRARRTLREELQAASRRASSLVPGWLVQGFGHADRLAVPARAVGVGLAVAFAATVTIGGAAPAPAERLAPAQAPAAPAAATAPREKPEPDAVASRRSTPPRRPTAAPRAPEVRRAEPAPVRASPDAAAGEPAVRLPDVTVPGLTAPSQLPLPPLPLPPLPLPLPLEVPSPPLPEVPALPGLP